MARRKNTFLKWTHFIKPGVISGSEKEYQVDVLSYIKKAILIVASQVYEECPHILDIENRAHTLTVRSVSSSIRIGKHKEWYQKILDI